MRDSEKVVLSNTLTEAPWNNARVFDRPAAEVVDQLRGEPGGDIVVLSSASVITALLAADRVDRISFTVFPEIIGGGQRLLDAGLPPSKWTLVKATAGDHGVLAIAYERVR
ncbi:hypothetical protein GCM10027290_54460 [Micromonospora sonneratiae]|uniref:Dihydrofolate reductase family protein n=1 Tax=Micromonospora sonneratiae TaxID=1184706 RepID=A0ABW3YIL4_9ACTN